MIGKIGMSSYSNIGNINDNNCKVNSNNKGQEIQDKTYYDTIELSVKNDDNYNYAKDRKNWVSNGQGGLTPILKGVVQMSRGDFNKIEAASLVPPLNDGFMELGKDERCKWVVINGVRYETPLSESEKPIKFKTLIEIIAENDKRMEDQKAKEKEYGKSEIIDLGENKAIVHGTLPKEALEMLSTLFNNDVIFTGELNK